MNKINSFLLIVIFFTSYSYNLYKGYKGYIAINLLSPGHLRYTVAKVESIITHLQSSYKRFNKNTASLDSTHYIPVILGPHHLTIMTNNHHEYLAAKSLGDETVPIIIIDDLRDLTLENFYHAAKLHNYIYPYNKYGEEIFPPLSRWYTWKDIEDDSNLFFVYISGWYCSPTGTFKDINATQFPLYPLWIKDSNNEKLTFIEFKIASILSQAGLYFNYRWGSNPNSPEILEFTEHARLILEEAIHQNDDRILENTLIPPA